MFGRKRRPVERELGRISPFPIRKKQTTACDAYHLSQLRIVLLGERGAGKSSAGNTILGREAFECRSETWECVRRKGEVEGREVNVVDTPGWSSSTLETPEDVRRELLRSVSVCPSGPHAFLLVIPVAWSLFTEMHRRAAEVQLDLFGGGVWGHTIVLFTKAEKLGEVSLQQHVEKRGQDLRQLVEACGNRCHALSNRRKASEKQVTELLEKIEKMVVANNGWHFKPNLSPVRDSELERSRHETDSLRKTLEEMRKEMEDMRRRYKQETMEREEELKLKFEEQWRKRECELKEEVKNTIKKELEKKTEECQLPVKGRRKDTIFHPMSWHAVPEKGQGGVNVGPVTAKPRTALVWSMEVGKTTPRITVQGGEEFCSKAICLPLTQKSEKTGQVVLLDTQHQAGFSRGDRGQGMGCYVNLPAPAPPAILLVMSMGQPLGEEWRQLLALREIFGEEASKRTVVLLMRSARRKRKRIKELAQPGQENLPELEEKSDDGHRTLTNNNYGGCGQVVELLDKREAVNYKNLFKETHHTEGKLKQGQPEISTETEEQPEEMLEEKPQILREGEQLGKEVHNGIKEDRGQAEGQEREVIGRRDCGEDLNGRGDSEQQKEHHRKHHEGDANRDSSTLKHYARPVAMLLGAGVGAVLVAIAGALKGPAGAAAAGAAIGAVAGAQIAAVL